MLATGHDVEYRPIESGWQWLVESGAREILVLGDIDDETAGAIAGSPVESRSNDSRLVLKLVNAGGYLFVRGASRVAIFRPSGPVSAPQSDLLRNCDSHLRDAWEVFQEYWAQSDSLVGSAEFSRGDLVQIASEKNSIGRVVRTRRIGSTHEIDVEVATAVQSYAPDDLEALDGDPRSPDFWIQRAPVGADDIARTLSWIKLSYPISDLMYSFAATRTVFKPYQFIPVLKLLRSATGRLLIADEVGLGKTIEAGLIWTELEQRSPVDRALVIAPAALKFKWQAEMRRRFMRPLEILSVSSLENFATAVEEGSNPKLAGIVTLESIRSAQPLLTRLSELSPSFDLVIVDEAHNMRNRTTNSFRVGELFATLAENLIYLSATPLNLGRSDLFNLVSTLDPGGFPDFGVFHDQLEPNRFLNEVLSLTRRNTPDAAERASEHLAKIERLPQGSGIAQRPSFKRLRQIVADGRFTSDRVAEVRRLTAELNSLGEIFTRTRKVDVPDRKATREAHQVEVQWSPEERRFYDAVYAHYRNRARMSGHPAGFIMQMPLRMASSCLPALQQHLARRENWALEDDELDLEGDEVELTEEQLDLPELRMGVLTQRLTVDSKLAALVGLLRNAKEIGGEKVLIFSFFRTTVVYLERMLREQGFRVRSLHGGVPGEQRTAIINDFQADQFDILIANQVGSEGLDFQFCHVLVNYDLPWNPMQVEQRIGRVDRFGQESDKIFIFNMHTPGTIESDILSRLYSRIGVFTESIGELEPILRSEFADIQARLLSPELSPKQIEAEIRRTEIALHDRAKQIRELEDSSGLLSSITRLEVEGLTDTGPSGGRYVGAHERAALVRQLVLQHGGKVIETRDGTTIRGSESLATALRRIENPDQGTALRGMLPSTLRDRENLAVTFDPNDPRGDEVEFVSSQHPLVRLAVRELAKDSLHIPRFGAATVPGLPPARTWVVQVDVVNSSGIRPQCELWFTPVEVGDMTVDENVADALARAHAEGLLKEWNGEVPLTSELSRAIAELQSRIVPKRFDVARRERKRENAALVETRMQSRRASLANQSAQVRKNLADMRTSGGDARIIRMHEGQLRNLETKALDLEAELSPKRHVRMTRELQAVLLIRGAD